MPDVTSPDRALGLRLSVVVPVFNEAAALRLFLPELTKVLAELHPDGRWELILVDDGSTDSSAEMIENILEPGRVFSIRHERRLGSGSARKTGVRFARGEWVAWIDADGTYDPRDLVCLLHASDGVDQVIGARREERGRWWLLRFLVKRAAGLLAGLLLSRSIPDLNSGLRIFRRACIDVWLAELPDGFSCTSTATLASMVHCQRVRFVTIRYRARIVGTLSKFHPIVDTWKLYRIVFRYGLAGVRGARSSLT